MELLLLKIYFFKFMFNMHKELITHLIYKFLAKPSGLLPEVYDPRDFNLGIFGWGKTYQPKHEVCLIKTRRVLDQQNYNTCQWCATTVCKENDEKIDLSERSIVAKGRRLGLLSGNGFSNLDAGDKVLKDWGIVETNRFDNSLTNGNFESYTAPAIDNWSNDAKLHKIESHWSVTKRGDIFKLLDDGKLLKTAIDWYTGFNQGGGFASRGYLMDKFVGYRVGGHAFVCKGYAISFLRVGVDNKIVCGAGGQNVYIFQNSYGAMWGQTVVDNNGVVHHGLFFANMDFFDKYGWVFKANLDMPADVGRFVNDYNLRNVKCAEENKIYLIRGGKKRQYLTPAALAKSNLDTMFVSKEMLDKVPSGDPIK